MQGSRLIRVKSRNLFRFSIYSESDFEFPRSHLWIDMRIIHYRCGKTKIDAAYFQLMKNLIADCFWTFKYYITFLACVGKFVLDRMHVLIFIVGRVGWLI